MRVNGTPYRSIWIERDGRIAIIDQRWLPHDFRVAHLETLDSVATAIRDMWVRGAPLIGATAAWGIALEMARDPSDAGLARAIDVLGATRPTAVNLRWALETMANTLRRLPDDARAAAAQTKAAAIADADVEINAAIGRHGLSLLQDLAAKKPAGQPLNILTHCNAGWIATVDWGTATAPMYMGQDAGLNLHVWVDETRPRSQGALTAWELASHGIPHTYIVDNAGGHLMQRGEVDLVLLGTDRVTAGGDVCNKIGTYLKALAARDCGVPFYVALPSPTIDWTLQSGHDIPIEERSPDEVSFVSGTLPDGSLARVRVVAEPSQAQNPAFDVTPAHLVTGLITERGIIAPDRLAELFPKAS